MPRILTGRFPPARWRRELATLLRFGLVGVSNTVVGLGVVYVCWHALGLPDLAANPIGFGVALMWSYLLNRRFTFRSQAGHRRTFVRFVVVSGLAYVASLCGLLAARHWLGPASFLPHLLANVLYTGLAFIAYRLVVFANGRRT